DSGATVINVLANDTDPEGNTLTVTAVTQPANGSVTFTAGNVSFTPAANFSGTTTFTYTISDGNGGTDTATVTVTVTGVNDGPDAVNDSATVAEDSGATVINVLANDTDPEGNTLTVTAVTQPANGSVTFTAGNVSFTPTANFFGTTTFTYTISDGNGGTDTATVTVTVTDVPDVALLLNEVEGDAPDGNFECQYVELLGAPGYVVPTGTYFASINGASGSFGDLSFIIDLGGQVVGTNGTISIINELAGTCANRTFPSGTTLVSVQDFDGLGLLDNGARTFAVLGTTAGLPGTDIDTNDDRVVDPSSGVVVVDGFALTTNNLFNAAYAPVVYEAISGGGNSLLPDAGTRFLGNSTALSAAAWYAGELAGAPAETTVYQGSPVTANFPVGGRLTPGAPNTLTPTNVAPDAVDDSATVAEDSGATVINVLANDTDGNGDTLTVTAVTQPANGSVTFTAGNVSFTPSPNFSGTTTFTYTISDGNGGTDTATVTVTVTPVNDPPVANADAATVNEDTTNNAINVLANDNNGGDGGALSVVAVSNPPNGSAAFTAGGVTYSPDPNFFGTDTFTYTVSDGIDTAVGTVTVTVTDIPEPPSVALLLNEVEGDAPDGSFECQYVEILGAPGYVVPAGTYFASVNGAFGAFGDLSFVVDLSGQIVGSNGTITIFNNLNQTPCGSRTFPGATTLVTIEDFDGLGLLDNGARTFAILSAPAGLPGTDIDTDDDRIVDPAGGVTVIDGFALTTNNLFNAAYAPVLYEAISGGGNTLLPDAATRFLGNTTAMSAAAWYAGELAGAPSDTNTYTGTPRTANFPLAGAALTPGTPNVP
ncbi:MAG: tandem-95 repeat protein, partial [Pyrinomonadaceae bacterium]